MWLSIYQGYSEIRGKLATLNRAFLFLRMTISLRVQSLTLWPPLKRKPRKLLRQTELVYARKVPLCRSAPQDSHHFISKQNASKSHDRPVTELRSAQANEAPKVRLRWFVRITSSISHYNLSNSTLSSSSISHKLGSTAPITESGQRA